MSARTPRILDLPDECPGYVTQDFRELGDRITHVGMQLYIAGTKEDRAASLATLREDAAELRARLDILDARLLTVEPAP